MRLKLEKFETLKKKEHALETLRKERPWMYVHKFYPWQREVLESINKRQVLVAANQVGKSSACIIKNIEWALNDSLWPSLFTQAYAMQGYPRQFWYMYPSLKLASAEFEEKWRPLMPPPDHPKLGWKSYLRGRDIDTLRFKNNAVIRFKTYAQDIHHLQAASVDFMTLDEEVPIEVLPELQMRVQATDGYMLFGFTATRGQTFWRKVVEDRSEWLDADIWQVSLHDCQHFEDGSESHWTNRRIQQAIANCTSDTQVQRRIFGRFVRDEGMKYEVWDKSRNLKEYATLSPEWIYYIGIDGGSGGSAHPSAIVIVAVNSDYTEARVVGAWRGDKITTTADDIVNKLMVMKQRIPEDQLMWIKFDHSAPDVGNVAIRRGVEKISKANKSRESGAATIQALLKAQALWVCNYNDKAKDQGIKEEHFETHKLIEEIETLGVDDNKTVAVDHLIDALRYAIIDVPFDWDSIGSVHATFVAGNRKPEDEERERDPRRTRGWDGAEKRDELDAEFDFWNNLLES